MILIMKIQLIHNYNKIISVDNLLEAWKEFEIGKRNKKDVQEFYVNLTDNIFLLHDSLFNHTYKHGNYQAFKINDPKPRNIHKAEVKDRLLHHAIYRILYPFFDKTFIADSYSCRLNKGTHKGVGRLEYFARQVSKNNTQACYVLKCDIRKFFASINHKILLNILADYIPDKDIMRLLNKIISSFNAKQRVGLPLGNLTSQLFANVCMNKFDQFVKHRLKEKKYIRYADDFVVVNSNPQYLHSIVEPIVTYLIKELRLELHPQKVAIRKYSQGVDFLGYIVLPHYRVLRTRTKKRMLKKLREKFGDYCNEVITKDQLNQTLQSYLGVLSHANAYNLGEELKNQFGLR